MTYLRRYVMKLKKGRENFVSGLMKRGIVAAILIVGVGLLIIRYAAVKAASTVKKTSYGSADIIIP